MAVWERYHGETTLSTAGSSSTALLVANAQADENFESSDLVIVDGIVTFITDSDNLCGARLLIVSDQITLSGLTEDEPQPHSQEVYYSWFYGRGPVVFRLRSKRTIPPEHVLALQIWKATGSDSTKIGHGMRLLFQVKH